MPSDADIRFGRAAVAAGDISQDQLDDAILLLHDLERVGSRRRLWDVLTSKGTLNAARAIELRRQLEETKLDPVESVLVAPQPGHMLLVELRPGGAQTHELRVQPMNIGSDRYGDICIEGANVEPRHARLTWSEEGPTIWDVGSERGVIVNGTRIRSYVLRDGDVIRLGEAALAAVNRITGDAAAEPMTTTLADGEPLAALRVIAGNRQGDVFYLSRHPLLIGYSKYCHARISEPGVAEFHAQVAIGPKGATAQALTPEKAIAINGDMVFSGQLDDGARLRIAETEFCFEKLRDVPAAESQAPTEAEAPLTFAELSEPSAFDVPQDVAVAGDELSDLAVSSEDKAAYPDEYLPGDLRITGLEGATTGQNYPLNKSSMILGRGKEAEIGVYDLSVSREHARLIISGGKLLIADLGSRNGIIINGRQTRNARLKVGDTIRIGACLLLVDWARRKE